MAAVHSGAARMAAGLPGVEVHLGGRFRVATTDGWDLTPKGAKAQGLLALLATSDNGSRGRLWLQDKLWSDRGREQGAASLRQALTEIRRAFGSCAPLLAADRLAVRLDMARCRVMAQPAGQSCEFLEGLDVRDEEFEHWLTVERARRDADMADVIVAVPVAAPATRRPRDRMAVHFVAGSAPGSKARLFEELFVDCVGRSLSEAMSADVYVGPAARVPPGALRVAIETHPDGASGTMLRAAVREEDTHRVLWSGLRRRQSDARAPGNDLDILLFGNQLIDGLAEALMIRPHGPREAVDANILHRLAVRKIFSMRPAELVAADGLLAQAREIDDRGIFAAWQAQLRAIQRVERHAGLSPDNLRDEADELCHHAMEREPGNSMVLAAVSNARLVFDDDVQASEELARRSVEMNGANPLAWDSLATAKIYAGKFEAAHTLAQRAQALGASAAHKFWWDMGLCLTAAVTGRAAEAVRLAETSHALSPKFRPPLRYLTALYAAMDQPEKAIAAAGRLRVIEPEFSFDSIAQDPRYPVGVLRRSGLHAPAKLRALGN